MLTLKQAAELVDGLSAFRIRKMCNEGILPHVKAGNKYLVNKTALFNAIGETKT
jgi:excisionase family DNA binding protein